MFAFLAPYRCIILGGISFVLLAGASTPVSAQSARVKSPFPDAAAQNKALALVREVYRDDFVGAKSDELTESEARFLLR